MFRACNEMDIATVGIYSREDKLALHRYKADEAYEIGRGKGPVAAYLGMEEIIALAKDKGVDAIHPGYGFLSERAEFAEAVIAAGMLWVGPSPEVMRKASDKVSLRALAQKIGVPIVPGSVRPVKDLKEARALAAEAGYPVMIKASHGGGGRGIRMVKDEDELKRFWALAQQEALAAFGSGECFVEKCILHPKHLEVQILGDHHGNIVHLFERDCSVQRRHQKVVEFAPSLALTDKQRQEICAMAVQLAKAAGYENAGTVEFLLDRAGKFYLIEMNTRIQVEHTVTEQVTGVDLVQAQIRIAEGYKLGDAKTRVPAQEKILVNGYAIQCRITTENPANDFAPDYGRISTYRSPGGFGVRLDGGTAFAGALITPYYDSLLVKATCWGSAFDEAARRLHRTLAEFRIRGLSTNLPFLINVVNHPTFLAGKCDTGFIDAHPELFRWRHPQDRASKLLAFLGDVSVNGNPLTRGARKAPEIGIIEPPLMPHAGPIPKGTRDILKEKGPEGLAQWVLHHKALLVTDTTFRDAHQSLLATRMRSFDMLAPADFYARALPGLFSLEMWGGATFDTAMRFLKEDPWERLARLREKIPNILFQMLTRGSSAVGYANYPDNVVKEFVREAAGAGVDVFRIFDSLNWLPNMEVSMDAVLESGKVCEAAICYTGDIDDPKREKYQLSYYVKMAKDLVKRGTHILAIKDMAGLCKPYAAKRLVHALKQEVDVPLHFHTHDTSSVQASAITLAAEAGVHVADMAIASMSGLTSQPNLNALAAVLARNARKTGLDGDALQRVSDYFEKVRALYYPFESPMRSGTADVYYHEMPGGQVTNFYEQAKSLGLESRWGEIKRQYHDVNFLFGDIVKVTPSSKVVGDMALFLVGNHLTAADVKEKGKHLSFPESVIEFFEGKLGMPPGGFDPELQKIILKDRKPLKSRAGALMKPVDWDALQKKLQQDLGEISWRDTLSSAMYPKVFAEFAATRKAFGDLSVLPTKNFFFGMEPDEEILVEIEKGKTLIIKLISMTEPNKDGMRKVMFELNGSPREINVRDKAVGGPVRERRKAEKGNLHHVAATIPGMVAEVHAGKGSEVKQGDVLMVLEAMKMQVQVTAPRDGVIAEMVADKGSVCESGDLLAVFE